MKKAVKFFWSLSLAAGITVQALPVFAASELKSVVASDDKEKGFDNGNTTMDMELLARYNSGAMNADGGSLEIVEYNKANGYAYAVSGIKGKVIAVPVKNVQRGDSVTALSGTEYDIKLLVQEKDASFTYGDVTSVSISPDGTKIAVAVQHDVYNAQGKIAVFDCGSDGALTNLRVREQRPSQ